jgi:hypothetical protein
MQDQRGVALKAQAPSTKLGNLLVLIAYGGLGRGLKRRRAKVLG